MIIIVIVHNIICMFDSVLRDSPTEDPSSLLYYRHPVEEAGRGG